MEPTETEGEVVERIKRDELIPINDSNHKHVYELDPDDETDDYYAEICVLKNCGMGRLIAKH